MIGKRVVGRQVDQQLPPAFGQIAAEGSDLRPWGNAFPRERFPDNLLQVNKRLSWPKGERLLVGGQNVGGAPVGHSRYEHAQADEEHDALPDVTSLVMHSTSFRADIAFLPIAKGHYTRSTTGDKGVEAGRQRGEPRTIGGTPSLTAPAIRAALRL